MRLIPEIREAWTFASVRLSAIATLAAGYWSTLDKSEQIDMLNSLGIAPAHVPLALAAAFMFFRLITFRKP